MSDTVISEAAKAKACELANAEGANFVPAHCDDITSMRALARLVQEVSDAVADALPWTTPGKAMSMNHRERLNNLILPEPVDPLEEKAQEIADEFRLNLSAMPTVEKALYTALRRGIELAKAGQP